MLTMDVMIGTLGPQLEPLVSLGAGALVAMVAFLALALAVVAGTARELRADTRTGAQRAVPPVPPRRLAA